MIRPILHFLLVWPERLSDDKGKTWVKNQEAALGPLLEKASDDTCRVVLTPRRIPALLDYFQNYRKEGGRINDFGIAEELVDDDRTPVEWFMVRSSYFGALMTAFGDLQRPIDDPTHYPTVKADRMRPGVLRISNGGRISDSPLADDLACILLPAEELAKARPTEAAYYRDIGTKLADGMLLILQTEIGDSIWLDSARQGPDGDCRVVLLSHETGEEERAWASIAYFLEELLTPEED